MRELTSPLAQVTVLQLLLTTAVVVVPLSNVTVTRSDPRFHSPLASIQLQSADVHLSSTAIGTDFLMNDVAF
jgi:PhoPQ-activated pathogenicity-related protein